VEQAAILRQLDVDEIDRILARGRRRGAARDLLWDEQLLAIEADGEETHGTPAAFPRDRKRDQILAAVGYRTARITWHQVTHEPTAVVHRIAHMLNAT
jgi:very-short-patch-repair endonuclease